MRLRLRRQEDISLNLTPLIDVVFLLLIFFMVTTTFRQQNQLSIELPETGKGEVLENGETIEIGIDAKGYFYLQGEALESTDKRVLKQALAKAIYAHQNAEISILGDKSAPHQAVVSAMEVAGQLGISQLRILAQIS